jgi:hypothetical protein
VLPKPVYPECLAEAIAEASKSAARAAPATTH